MKKDLRTFFRDDKAATAIEYAMIAAFIVLAIVVTLPLLGTTLSEKYQAVVNLFH